MSDAYERGMVVRRRVLGDAHVDRAEEARSAFETPFQKMITETAWGAVWAGDTLSPRERSLITLALLATLGQWDEFAMHVRATVNTGASPEDVREALMHVAIYAGVPAANHAFGIARRTFDAMAGGDPAADLPSVDTAADDAATDGTADDDNVERARANGVTDGGHS